MTISTARLRGGVDAGLGRAGPVTLATLTRNEGACVEEQVLTRLVELRREFASGQQQLQEQERQQATMREALFRISGAIQVLEELLAARQAVTLHPSTTLDQPALVSQPEHQA